MPLLELIRCDECRLPTFNHRRCPCSFIW